MGPVVGVGGGGGAVAMIATRAAARIATVAKGRGLGSGRGAVRAWWAWGAGDDSRVAWWAGVRGIDEGREAMGRGGHEGRGDMVAGRGAGDMVAMVAMVAMGGAIYNRTAVSQRWAELQNGSNSTLFGPIYNTL